MSELFRETVVDEFLNHIRFFEIVHHVQGRIRVKAVLSSVKELNSFDRDQLEHIVARIPGITNYRVNPKALSVVIEYKPEILPYDLWEDVGSLESYPLKREEIRNRLIELLE